VLTRVDILATPKPCEDFGAPVANASRLNVEQIAIVGLQRVSNVGKSGAVEQNNLPVGARAWEQRAVEIWTGEPAASLGHNATAALGRWTEIHRLAEGDVKAVNEGETGSGKLTGGCSAVPAVARVVGMG